MSETLHERVKTARNRKGITLEELEKASNVTIAALHRIESGKAKPHAKTLKKIAAALGVEYTYLLEGKGETQETQLNLLDKGHPAYIIEITDLANEGFGNLNKLKMKGKKIYLPDLRQGDNFGITLNNRNHEPELKEGSTIIAHKTEEKEFENSKYYILIVNGTPVIRKVEKIISGTNSGKYKLIEGNNSQVAESSEIQAWFIITHSFQTH